MSSKNNFVAPARRERRSHGGGRNTHRCSEVAERESAELAIGRIRRRPLDPRKTRSFTGYLYALDLCRSPTAV